MSLIITSRKEIPDAPLYIMANDKFMSGWGQSPGTNTLILPCDTKEEADIVMQNCQARPEFRNVRMVINKPRLRSGVTYSLYSKEDTPLWYTGR